MNVQKVVLEDFLEAAGKSFETAQGDLGLPEGLQTRMMFEDAVLEIKVEGVGLDGRGRLTFSPVSLRNLSGSVLSADVLSTIKVHYVAARPEPSAAGKPSRTREEVVEEVAGRKDIENLRSILGDMAYHAKYQPEVQAWTVRVADGKDRTVRIVNIDDKLK